MSYYSSTDLEVADLRKEGQRFETRLENLAQLFKRLSAYATNSGLLTWIFEDGYQEAQLGKKDDGVLFCLTYQATCHRRGQWRLLVEVCDGENHKLWGCFDDQDQPMRYYHSEIVAKIEADCLAMVLWLGRVKNQPPEGVELIGNRGPTPAEVELAKMLNKNASDLLKSDS